MSANGTASTRRPRRRRADVRHSSPRRQDPRAVIVAFHGGASTAAYFDCPGHPRLSMLRAGAAGRLHRGGAGPAGLRRLGALPRCHGSARNNASHWPTGRSTRSSERVPAVPVCFYSATPPDVSWRCGWPPTSAPNKQASLVSNWRAQVCEYHPATAEILKTATATERPKGLRDILWQPADLYPNDVLSGMTNSTSGATYEVDMTKKWPQQDFPALAARVSVPVQFTVAEHERVWRSDPETLAEIGAMFTLVAAVRDQRTGRHADTTCPFRSAPPTTTRRCCRSSGNVLQRNRAHRRNWRRVDARRIHRTGQPGRPHGAADR